MEDKVYYSISEVSKEFNLTQATLRYWEKIFSQLKPAKNRRGARLYRKEDIEIIKQILYLTKDRGLTLEGAKKELNSQRISAKENEVLNTLIEARDLLTKIKQALDNK